MIARTQASNLRGLACLCWLGCRDSRIRVGQDLLLIRCFGDDRRPKTQVHSVHRCTLLASEMSAGRFC